MIVLQKNNNKHVGVNERVFQMFDTLQDEHVAFDIPHTINDSVGNENGREEQIGYGQSEDGLVVHLTLEAYARGANETCAHEIGASTLLVQVDANEEEIAGRADQKEQGEYARGQDSIGQNRVVIT